MRHFALSALLLFLVACAAVAVAAKSHRAKHDHAGHHHSLGADAAAAAAKPVLRFHNNVFRIMQFTDLHFGMDNNLKVDAVTLNVTRKLLAAEPNIDLVVYTGDTIMNTGGNCTDAFWADNWDLATRAVREHGNIPWAWVSGNHDDEYCKSPKRAAIADNDFKLPLSLTQRVQGLTGVNYLLPVLEESADAASAAAFNIWMLDSGAYDCFGVPTYGCVAPDVISWYRQTVAANKLANNGKTTPAMAFMHIPLPEYNDMWNYFNVTGSFWTDQGGCSSLNTGLYTAIKEQGDVKAMSVGHDHDCDYIGDYHGVTLMYGRKTGYGCYGPPDGFLSGARVFEITQEPFSIKTWIRLDDGTKVVPSDVHVPTAADYRAQC